jgi:O-antigen ligase
LALAALAAAAFQGLYGLLVLASGHDRIWSVPKTAYLDSATGTFINHNHFAGFLAATLPLGVGLVIAGARRARDKSRAKGGVIGALGPDGSKALLLGLLTVTGAAGLLLSFSRAGTALGVIAVAGTAGTVLGGKRAHRLAAIAVVVAIAAVPLLDLGADRLVARYAIAGDDLRAPGGRLDVVRDTLRMIAAFPVFGCGFGTYTWAFPAFSSPDVRLHYSHAHNDLLQLGAEGGLPALALFAIALAAAARAVFRALRGALDPLAIGAAFGLAALLVHGLVDFNFHIPANAAIAAVLTGVLFGKSWNGRS